MKLLKWQDKIIYQIFPRSFFDTSNDGNGDIKGIIKKLNYLSWLGVDALWLCPVYETEFADAGYDVLDYYKVWEKFGTLKDFKTLIKKAKELNIEIIMDIVLNHTSTSHEWFKKAIEDPTSKEFNYYIWQDKATDEKSIFGSSAWEYVPSIKKYYFHLFSISQADLNWENPATIDAMADVINYWYTLGVKGFRLDAIQHIHKDFSEKDTSFFSFGKKMTSLLQDLKSKIDKEDIFLIGESSGIQPELIPNWTEGKNKIVDNFFNFSWWWIGWNQISGRNGYNPDWSFKDFYSKQFIEYQESNKILDNAFTVFWSNHDTSRALSRWGNENIFWEESAKTLALFQFTLKGLMCIYYGEEIGMLNTFFDSKEELRDVDAINSFSFWVDEKKYYTENEMLRAHNINSRDNTRTPMLWDEKQVNFGFSKAKNTWIKLNQNSKNTSVEKQIKNPNSILNFYRKLIQLRKDSKFKNILLFGTSKVQTFNNFEVSSITREFNGEKIISYINLSSHSHSIVFPKNAEIILSSYSEQPFKIDYLRAYESIMFYTNEKKND
ncbi:alpha-amylase family glycosyl hydrolase [[Mycoplasma] mobile]|uniref:Alpha-amylase n=1 Tax=Mycoplasma mobile (strain ATCC 43663 / 163K / NCTC 11711) TaxID=267748 RepID=Q6KHP7_MYCM1|nr:alpha-amylase family glycosyl hydrolase [[Mycoplasma] mobile]AAT27883.1 alpha-glucosidase [Mycoplasma mobile 163K]